MMSEAYFHVAALALGTESIIQPGNWGRIIRRYTQNNLNWAIAIRELTFESVRLAEYPQKPSRLKAAFVFEDAETARTHIQTQSIHGVIHRVELADDAAPTHRADYKLLDFPDPTTPLIPWCEESSRKYWRSEDIQVPELVTLSPLRVLECLE